MCFSPNSRAVQSWEVCELEFDFIDCGPLLLAIENFSKWPVRPYRSCTGQVWYVHWFPSWKVSFGPNRRAVQYWEACELEFQFFQWRAYVSYGDFFKVPCATVHELYRSNLVCTLIPIWKGVLVRIAELYSHWKYVNWNLILSIVGLYLLGMENFSKWPVRLHTNCTGQVWYVHWFPSWKVCFGPNSRVVQSWKVSELEFEFFNGEPMLAMENSSKSPMRLYTSCIGQIWYVHWFPSWNLCFDPNSRAV